VIVTCKPAIKLANVERAAMPTTTPAIPADAKTLVPICRAPGKVTSMAAIVITTIEPMKIRSRTSVWVWMRRA
jgi:hypothetical protein